MNNQDVGVWSRRVGSLVVVWLLAVLTAGYFRVFDAGSPHSMSVPIPLGLAAVVPILVFIVWYQASAAFRGFVLALNPVVLTAVQSWRVGGIIFLILMAKAMLPPAFAYPAGLGDFAIGVTAPFVAMAMARKKISTGSVLAWQIAGIIDLVVAVGMGVLSSHTRLGILAHGTSARVMGLLPMSLIPTFAVPLLLILHLTCIARVRQDNSGKIQARQTIAARA